MGVKVTVPNNSSDSVTFGSANTPTAAEVKGYDDGSSNGHLEFYTTASGTSAEKMRIDSSGNVGIGTSSPNAANKLEVTGDIVNSWASGVNRFVGSRYLDGANYELGMRIIADSRETRIFAKAADTGGYITMATGTTPTERMRIDSSGNLLVGTTSASASNTNSLWFQPSVGKGLFQHLNGTATGTGYLAFIYNGSQIGSITQNGTTATAYNTSSDYRLKENIAPMTGGLSLVQQLKPVTYTWKADGSQGQGFIAHELAEVVPDAVTGEKDAVETYIDEDGVEQTRPVYQGIDTSFLVATLTAAIQELKTELDAVKAELNAMKGTA